MVQAYEAGLTAVSFSSLVDWLVGRGYLKQGWRAHLRALQERILELRKTLRDDLCPAEDAIIQFQSAREVRDRLAETAPRNLLNNLTGPARSWDKLVKAYQARNLHLGEAALVLVRLGEFDLPHLHGKISRQQHQLSDLQKRQVEHARSVQLAQTDYAKECAALGINGQDIVKELALLTNQLPDIAHSALQCVHSPGFPEAVSYYADFSISTKALCGKEGTDVEHLPILRDILQAKLAVPDPHAWASKARLDRHEALRNNNAEQNSRSGGDPESTAQIGIDWDIDLEVDITEPDTSHHDSISERQECRREDDTTAGSSSPWHRLIDDKVYRSTVLAELSELLAFLRQCTAEATSGKNIGRATEGPPEASQLELETMITAVQSCITAMTAEKFTRLLGLHSSPRFFSRLVSTLEVQASQEAKHFRLLKHAESKAATIQDAVSNDAGNVEALRAEIKQTKKFLEEQMQDLLNGQKVEITGLGKALSSST